ncbi:GP46-like surface antigen, putative [Bodo saltans]|uniref:GP46-like surface antigen, putative n=1 Tax=Bodo saltans TaxID=75058 RepID=A0A0S4J2L4_BODSA|nr:GP46-like surface antigen, putative [Bodo saltans]|eukprot:CUG85115.1 GP46-like surface antigen, putative [Bodo saltans]
MSTVQSAGMCGCQHRYSLLMDLYNATNGAGWFNNSGWSMTPSACITGWYGVTCDGSDVTVVALHENSLAGTLPLSCWNLTNLTTLDFGINSLSGTLPLQVTSLTRLTALYLHANSFSGTLPLYWANMTQLMYLYVSYNSLTGTLPPQWSSMTQLRTLSLQGSRLSGTLPLEGGHDAVKRTLLVLEHLHRHSPFTMVTHGAAFSTVLVPKQTEWFAASRVVEHDATHRFTVVFQSLSGVLPSAWSSMTQLTDLQLSTNSLSGTLPPQWPSMVQLRTLQLSYNSLTGLIPPEWARMTQITELYLQGNSLSGTLSSALANLTTLRVLSLGSNQFNGTLPATLSRLPILTQLYLWINIISGTLPPEWGSMTNLNILQMSNNSLIGTLPPEWSSMTDLELSTNSLTGTLPPQWSSLSELRTLLLSYNGLTGTLPNEWSSMTRVTGLYLQGNSLSGSLNSGLPNMTALSILSLGSNKFSGTLPATFARLTQLTELYLWVNSISGTLPPEWSSMAQLTNLDISTNSLSGTLPFQWSNMTRLVALYLASNNLTGVLPFLWRSLSSLKSLFVGVNCLTGAVPFTLSTTQVNTCGTRLRGGVNVTPCAGQTWPASVLQSFVIENEYNICFNRSLTNCVAYKINATMSLSNAAMSLLSLMLSESQNRSSSTISAWKLSPTPSVSTSRRSFSDSTTVWQCFVAVNDTVTLTLTPLEQQIVQDAVVLLFDGQPQQISGAVLLAAAAAAVGHQIPTMFIVPRAVSRSYFVGDPPFLAINVSFGSAFSSAAISHWTIRNLTVNHQRVNATVYTSNTMPWVTIVLHPPSSGWIDASTSLMSSKTLTIEILFLCDAASVLLVQVAVEVAAAPRALASQVDTAGSITQITSLFAGGATSGASLSRVMAVRQMVLCDAAGAVGGGVIDMELSICDTSAERSSLSDARSAIISNIVLVGAVTTVLLLFVALWVRVRRTSFLDAVCIFCLPSSLLPVLSTVVPSTTASSVLLFARVGTSTCVGVDVVLAVLGLIIAALPFFGFLLIWFVKDCSGVWRCQRRSHRVAVGLDAFAMVRRALHRSHEWDSSEQGDHSLSAARVVLLEYCDLRYGVLDSGCLFAVACLSVVSGLSGSEAQCRAWSFLALLLLLLVQFVLLVVLRPLTTVVSTVHSFVTLGLTLLSVLSQLVFIWGYIADASGLWLVEASAVCTLAVVGVTGVKMVVDFIALAFAVKRRINLLCAIGHTDGARSSPLLHFSNMEKELSFLDQHDDDDGDKSTSLEQRVVGGAASAVGFDGQTFVTAQSSSHYGEVLLFGELQLTDDDKYWDASGVAVGTQLVDGHSDILFTSARR